MSEEKDMRRIECENALHRIAHSVGRLWVAVEESVYSSRSIVGDETLNMKEALQDVGVELPLDAKYDLDEQKEGDT